MTLQLVLCNSSRRQQFVECPPRAVQHLSPCHWREGDRTRTDGLCEHLDLVGNVVMFNLKTIAGMSPIHICVAKHSRFAPPDFLQEAAIIYLLASLGDWPRTYWHHHRRGHVNHRRLSTFLSPQQNDVRRIALGLGMDALVSVCSWNPHGIMVWAWMLWLAYAGGTRTELWFGHGCSG